MKIVFKRVWLVVAIVLAMLCLCLQYFRLSGRYGKKVPVIETRPNNCYDKTLRVLARPYYNPYTFYNAEGVPTGHDVELINIIANELEMNLELRLTDWNTAIETVKNGEADVLMACEFFNIHSPESELAKTVYTVYDEFAVFGKKPLEKTTQLIDKRFGVLKNGNVSSDLHSMGLAGKCTGYDSYFAAFKALMNGECEYVIGRTAVGIAILDNLGAKDIKPFMSIGSSSMCFGLSPDNKELIARINDIIMKLKTDGTLERLHSKWLTTFVQPYTFQDVMRNNPWLPLTTAALFAILAYVYIKWPMEKFAAVRKANELRQILSSMVNDYDSIIHFDFDKGRIDCYRSGRLLKDNMRLEHIRPFNDFMKEYATIMIIPEDREEFISKMTTENILPTIKAGKMFSIRFRYGAPEAPHWLGINMMHHSEHKDKNCAIIGFRDMTEEISTEQRHQTELKEQNRKLEAARDLALAANNAKTAFLFNMSHDIRTPMGVILGFIDLAINNIDDKDKALDCLRKTKASGEHLLSLINDILEMSRIESGKVTLEEKNIDIINVCESALPMLRQLADEKNILFNFKQTNITDKCVYADRLRLSQIIINVISNAMKYTDSGGSVSFTLSQEQSAIKDKTTYCFVIEDTGIGMSKDFQSHIFETFSRENTSTVSGRQGTGLGMAITKNLVGLMGGTIKVESEQGKGSCFTIKIPLRPVGTNDNESITSVASDNSQPSLNGKKVLLVDDNDLNREIAAELLMANGMEVEMAEDGSIALEMLKSNGCEHYDFVLMDIQMPIMDGYEATNAIRALPNSANLPIIALSANAFEEDRQKSLKAGMNAHIAKPIKVNELLDTLRRFA